MYKKDLPNMKKLLLFCFIAILTNHQNLTGQEGDSGFDNKLNFYPTINLFIGNPVQEFWSNYSKQNLWGFNIDGVITPFKKAQFFETGVQIEILPSSNRNDTWQGIEVNSSSTISRFNAISRFRVAKQSKISPYIELGYGLNITSTQTSYEIVDEATFLEVFLWEAEDVTETVKVKDFHDYGHNLYAGVGLNLYNWINLQVKYNYSPTIEFVQKDGIKVEDSSINYETTSSKIQMLVITVGISFDKLFVKDN